MKLLVVVYKFGTREEIGKNLGSFDYFLDQLAHLKKRGVDVTVLAPWVSWTKKGSEEVGGIRVVRYWPKLAARSLRNLLFYKFINRLYIWRTGKFIADLASRESFDAIYVRQSRETGAAAARVKSLLKIPAVFQPITTWRWHFEEASDSWFRKIVKDTANQKQYAAETLENFDYFITYNSVMRDEYAELGADPKKFTIIPGAVDSELFRPMPDKGALRRKLDLPEDKKIILYIGRINFAEKGLDYLLEAFKTVNEQMPESFLLMLGPSTMPELEKLRALIEKLGLDRDCLYLGSKDYRSLPEYINAADIGAIPSVWFESSGRVSLDMLSCGLPVVLTNVGGMPEYSVDGETGCIVEPKNADALAEKLMMILRDPNLQKRLSENARNRVLTSYTFDRTADQLIGFLKSLIRNS